MNDDMLRKLTGQAESDQVQAGIMQFSATLTTLYRSLLESGMPDALASDMTRDWFRMQLHKQLWPDDPPTWEG